MLSAPAAAAPTGVVFDVKRGSAEDGPGIRTTVFLEGCPLRCAWCHNPEGLDARPVFSVVPGRCLASGGGARCGFCAEACPEGAITLVDYGAPCVDRARCTTCGRCVDACPTAARELRGVSWSSAALVDELARDYNAGGARYDTTYIQGVGIGTVTDAPSALRRHVCETGAVGLPELVAALDADFAAAEPPRQRLVNRTPRHGNDDPDADELMQRAALRGHLAGAGRRPPRPHRRPALRGGDGPRQDRRHPAQPEVLAPCARWRRGARRRRR